MLGSLRTSARQAAALRPGLLLSRLPAPLKPPTAAPAPAPAAAAAAVRRSFASISATEARQGHLLVIDGRKVEVTEFRQLKSGRGAASVSLSYVDLNSLKAGSQTFAVQKKIEKIEAEKQLLRVMYVEAEKGLVVMADNNFDEVHVPLRLFGGPSVANHLTPEMEIAVLMHEGLPLKVNLPTSILTLLRNKK